MIKNFVLDTNVLVHSPNSIYTFEDNNVILPIICLEELDNLKNKEGLVGFQARNALREINKVREFGNIHMGVDLPGGGTFRIELNHLDVDNLPNGLDFNKNDNKIIAIVNNIKLSDLNTPTILVTKDLCVAIKAESLDLAVQDYQNDKINTDDIYKGFREVSMLSSDMDKIYRGGLNLPEEYAGEVFPNEFFCINSIDSQNHKAIAKYDGEKIVPLKYDNEDVWGLIPRNKEQRMALELLMDDSISLVTLSGAAGTGKTIVAVATALQKVVELGLYDKIVFVKPVVPAGQDIGFLPGSETEKLSVWMQSFYDAAENLSSMQMQKKPITDRLIRKDGKKGFNEKPTASVDIFLEGLIDAKVLETKTLNYMRGRTLSRAIIILDESQQLPPALVKLMLTRAGNDSKFIMLGDPSNNQIDSTYLDSKSNGLVYAIEKMKNSKLTAHITLEEVERSPLAALASEML
ncbi:MAG: PhoH family protein [Eubacteriales bacterium]